MDSVAAQAIRVISTGARYAPPVPRIPSLDADTLAEHFGARDDLSARSMLVTIFGDAVVPAGGEIWLADLIELCAPFGFNHRLVRTSLSRLTAEGWFATERVGRRSRYRLAASAIEEFADAEERIYHLRAPAWDGRWTFALLDGGRLDRAERDTLRGSLRWQGFAQLAPGILALPRSAPGTVHRLARRLGITAPIPVVVGEVSELAALVADGWTTTSFDLDAPRRRYDDVLVHRSRTTAVDLRTLEGRAAFLLRTMVVHDLRRARLSDPDLPDELLPPDWPAQRAFAFAATLYRRLGPASDDWLDRVAGLRPATPAAERFSGDDAVPAQRGEPVIR